MPMYSGPLAEERARKLKYLGQRQANGQYLNPNSGGYMAQDQYRPAVNNMNQSTDPYQLPQNKPTLSSMAPNQIPGGPGPISMDPRSGGMGPAGGRPQRPPTTMGMNFAPGQPGTSMGPSRFANPAPGFRPTSSYGTGRPMINPYQPQQRQFKNTVW